MDVKSLKRSSNTVNVWRCSVCDRVLSSKGCLRVHMNIHTGERRHKCETCNKEFTQKTHLICHMKTHNKQRVRCSSQVSTQFSCRVCGKSFKSSLGRNSHMRCHKAGKGASLKSTDKLFKCKFCGKVFPTYWGRTRHIKLHMKELGPIRVQNSSTKIASQNEAYKCNECDLTFKSYVDLNQHRDTHTKVQPAGSQGDTGQGVYQCVTCDRTFRSYVYLKLHTDTHELRNQINRVPVTRELPSVDKHKTCSASVGLKLETSVSGEPEVKECKYVCHICSETFQAVLVLKQHLQTHVVKREVDVESTAKPHLCTECGQRFLRAHDLKHHLEIHARGGYKCSLCEQVFTFQSWLKRHMKKAHDNIPLQTSPQLAHQCSVCGQAFNKKLSMINHMKYSHKVKTAQSTSSSQGEGDLDQVVTQGTSEKSYPCLSCDQTFLNWSGLYRHKRKAHKKNEFNHCCSICNKKFAKQDVLRKHVRQHGVMMRHQCQSCDKSFSLKCNLRRHMRLAHEKCRSQDVPGVDKHHQSKPNIQSQTLYHGLHNDKNKCAVCGKCFSNYYCYKLHLRIHTGEKPHSCNICGKLFSYAHQIYHHKRSQHQGSDENMKVTANHYSNSSNHGKSTPRTEESAVKVNQVQDNDQNTCSVCGKCFSSYYHYKLHLRIHTGEKPHSCNICGKSFSYAHQIYHHKRSQHQGSDENMRVPAKHYSNSSNQGKSLFNPSCSKRATKRNRCLLCKKSFSSPSGLSSHMRVHVMFKPHVCFCGKSFTNIQNLKRHKLLHVSVSEGDMFVCSVCKTTFRTSNDLLSHIQVKHYKLYPSKKSLKSKLNQSKAARLCQCGKCKKRFHFTYQLNSHVKRHTGETSFTCPCGQCFSFRHHLKRHISHHFNPHSKLYIKGFEQTNATFIKQFKKTELAQHRCEKCFRVFTDLHSFKRHTLTHLNRRKTIFSTSTDGSRTGHKFKCILCDEKFSSKVKQKYHLKCHTDPRSKLCVTQVQPELLQKQLRILEEKQRHRCAICKNEFESQTLCRQHLQTHSNTHSLKQLKNGALVSNETLWCVFCDRRFDVLSQLIIHVRRHTGIKPYTCSFCQKTFSLPYSLKDHVKNMHGKQQQADLYTGQESTTNNQTQLNSNTSVSYQHRCQICHREFPLLGSLKIHISKTHGVPSTPGSRSAGTSPKLDTARKVTQTSSAVNNDQKLVSKSHTCTFCKKSFPRIEDVLKHYISCSESSGKDPYHCPLCSKAVGTPSKLYTHFRRHSTEKQFKCPVCECSYKRRADMETHMKKLHSSKPPVQLRLTSPWSASRPECSVERIRERARAFPKKDVAECVVCDKTFKQKLAFNVHMRIHTGELPYACEVCGKRFMLLSNKIVHVKLLHKHGKGVTQWDVDSRQDGQSPGKIWTVPYEAEVQDGNNDEDQTEEDVWEECNGNFGEDESDTMLIDGHMIYVDRASPVEYDDEEYTASDDELMSEIEGQNIHVETGNDFESRAATGNINETVNEATEMQDVGLEQNEVQGQPNAIFGDHPAVVGGYDSIVLDRSEDQQGQGDGLQGQGYSLQGYSLSEEMLSQVDGMKGQNELLLHQGSVTEAQYGDVKSDGLSNDCVVYSDTIVDTPVQDLSPCVGDAALAVQDLSHRYRGVSFSLHGDVSLGVCHNEGISDGRHGCPLDLNGNNGVQLDQHGVAQVYGRKQQSDIEHPL